MYQILLITVLLCQAQARNIALHQNLNLTNCLGMITKHILKNFEFETNDDFNFEATSLLNSIGTVIDYESYSKNLHIIVLDETHNKPIFDSYGFDKKILIVQKDSSRYNPELLLVDEWIRRRTKIGILQIEGSNATLISNFNLDSTKVCTGYFYEYTNCSTSLKISKHRLSKNFQKKLCKLKVSWVRAYPFVDDVKRKFNPGLMVSFLKVYSEKRQVKLAFQKNNSQYEHELLYNGTFHKLRKDLLEGKYDVAIGLLFMNRTDEVPFSYGTLFFNEIYYMVTKKRDRITSYKKLTIVFNVDVWKSCLVTYLLTTVSYFLLNVAVESNRFGFIAVTFDVFRLSLSNAVSVLPRSVSLRLLFIFYSFFSINIDSAYLGTLSSIFTNAPYDVMQTDIGGLMRNGEAANFNWITERLFKLKFVASRSFYRYSNIGNVIGNESDEELLKRVSRCIFNCHIMTLFVMS